MIDRTHNSVVGGCDCYLLSPIGCSVPLSIRNRNKTTQVKYHWFFTGAGSWMENARLCNTYSCLKYILLSLLFFSAGCSNKFSYLNARECYQKGEQMQSQRQTQKAYSFFAAAADKAEKGEYHWAAAQIAPHANAALFHTKSAWSAGMRTYPVLYNYLRLAFFTDSAQIREKGLEMYAQLPDSLKNELMRAKILYLTGDLEACLNAYIRQFHADPSSELGLTIARVYVKKGDLMGARSFLVDNCMSTRTSPQSISLLASLYAREYMVDSVRWVFKTASRFPDRIYSPGIRLAHAHFSLLSGSYDDAHELLRELYYKPNARLDNAITLGAALSLGYLYSLNGDSEKLKQLSRQMETKGGNARYIKGTGCFFDLLQQPRSENDSIMEMVHQCDSLLPSHDLGTLMLAHLCAEKNEYAEAVKYFDRLSSLIKHSPGVVVARARATAALGVPQKAIAILEHMHRKNVASRRSLELYRNIALTLDYLNRADMAQDALEQRYPRDTRVIWNRAMIALKKHEFDTAFSVFTRLVNIYPQTARFRVAAMRAALLNGDTRSVMQLYKNRSADNAHISIIAADAALKEGDPAHAHSIYVAGMEKNESPQVAMAYARFLLEEKKDFSAAASVYRDVLKRHGKRIKEDTLGTVHLFNNLAWTLLHQETPDMDLALKAATHAYSRAQHNVHVVDTYAEALIRSKNYSECISVLKDSELTEKEPKLRYQLARAYEKKGEKKNALHAYRNALFSSESDSTVLKTDSLAYMIDMRTEALLKKQRTK